MKELILMIYIFTGLVLIGVLIGMTLESEFSQSEISYLTEKTQDQYFEIQTLKGKIEVCEYNAGVKKNIVLGVYTR